MKITTRIISGYGLFIAVLLALVVYQSVTIPRIQALTKAIKDINFQNADTCLRATKELEWVAEYTSKSFVDPDYLNQLEEFKKDFEASLAKLKESETSAAEQAEVTKLGELWNTFGVDLEFERNSEGGTALPKNVENDLDRLRLQLKSVYTSTLNSMSAKVDRADKTGKTAVLVLQCATGVALAISILLSLLIYRSISKPLAHLTEGTRKISEGKFFYRLDTTRKDEFAQLAKDFNTMSRRLNELDELKKDFVSHVSHELKAPLASMRETIQLLLEQIPGPLTDKQKRLLELSLQSGTRLTSMISNLLDLSKTEAGVMEYELRVQDLRPLVRHAAAELEVQASERQIKIEAALAQEPVMVQCDGDRIVQVLVNLIGNAVKFSPRGAVVRVDTEALASLPDRVPPSWRRLIAKAETGPYGLVTVSDSGPGVPDREKEKIFEKFHQVKHGRKAAGQGVGLGLAICWTIIQAHRGAIWVENNPGGGSRFLMLLRPAEQSAGAVSLVSSPI